MQADRLKRILSISEILFIIVLAIVPVLASFPYRLNIFLSWEGAYRMSEGQVPYRDFGMPVGYMFWVIPAAFFKIFGAQMITLVKAQAFINILSGLAFRSIIRSVHVPAGLRFLAVVTFCLSYSFFNYWPWYNHTVIVYELIAIAFLFAFLYARSTKWKYLWLLFSGVFVFFSFFTKQDGGALALLICLALLSYHAWESRHWKPILIFAGAFVVTGTLMIVPHLDDRFGYWFNHGQPPHSSRISIRDIIGTFLSSSQWIKFYILVIIFLLLVKFKDWKNTLHDRNFMLFTLLTLGILAEAAIFQVTSYVPEDNNIFFHSFAITYILYLAGLQTGIEWNKWKTVIIMTAAAMLWWSQVYWRYVERFLIKPTASDVGSFEHAGYRYSNEVNRNTYMIELDTTDIPLHQWRIPALHSFDRILLPGPTVDGIERLMKMPGIRNNKSLRLLNMTELTPLAAEIPFELEKGNYYPLWYHKGVGMFDGETNMFIDRIHNKYYDVVLFEYIPYLNNFYPYKVREALIKDYKLVDRFPAPRKPSSHAWVEVYGR